MQTNILLFLLFSIIAVFIIRFIPCDMKKYGILFLNIFFYVICDYRFSVLIFTEIFWSFFWGKAISDRHSKIPMVIGITPVLFVLLFFKYYHFFIPENDYFFKLIMPLGISYYTFKIISYLADIASHKRTAETSFVNYAVYVSFFPQIICGPISRSEEIISQLNHLQKPSEDQLCNGFMLILSGLFKKLVIADRISPYVDTVFSTPSTQPALALWMCTFFFSIQLYCDFAGYSELVIGICKLLGIDCTSNFNLPYLSRSIKEFWSRWHISLSSWLRDYVYIPLGGNRKGIIRKSWNIIITFLISGIWHGNTLSYILWGLWHGFFNLIPTRKTANKLFSLIQMIGTFFIVMIGWIFFRLSTLKEITQFLKRMFFDLHVNYQNILSSIMPFTNDYSCLSYFLVIMIFIAFLFLTECLSYYKKTVFIVHPYVLCIIYTFSIILFGVIGQSSFLYANY